MRLTRFASPLTLALILSVTACHKASTTSGRSPKGDDAKAAKRIQLPEPLPLPAEPLAAAWVAQPSRALAMLAPYAGTPLDGRNVAEFGLSQVTTPELASTLAAAIDAHHPFGHVFLDNEEVFRIGVRADARESLAATFGQLQAVGEFGAVRLPGHSEDGQPPRAGAREWLMWIDEDDGGTLVLANTLRGLVTARHLAPTYGLEPVFFTVDFSHAQLGVPLGRVHAHGSLDKLVIDAQALEGQDPLAEVPLTAGSLGGLLAAKDVAVGVSGRYSEHEGVVRDITAQVNAQVRELPFLVKGIGEDLAAKFNTLLRTWDGRVLVALGPVNHVRIAYGADDSKKSGVATIRLLQSIVDNVSLARNFVSQLPKLSLRRRVAKSEGIDVELFVVHDAQGVVPAELRPLLDREGKLNVAMAWSERGGGGLIVVGPDAVVQLSSWLEQTRDAPAHTSTAEQLLAASFAAAPEMLQTLLSSEELDPSKLFGISASGPRWDVGVAGQGGRYQIELHTPGPPPIPRAKG